MSMKLSYSLDDYIKSPSGPGSMLNSAVSINLDKFRADLAALESKYGQVTRTVYTSHSSKSSTYFIHFKIPSSTPGFYNDLVFQFDSPQSDATSVKDIRKYKVKFFANDAFFVFTYAYAYNKHGLLISDLEKKLPAKCISQKPVTRNPDNAMGYSRNIVFGYLVMEREQLFEKQTLGNIAKPGGLIKVRSEILSYDKQEQERKGIEKELREKNGKDKHSNGAKVWKSKSLLSNDKDNKPAIRLTGKVSRIGKTKTTKVVKKSKRI